MQRIIDIFAAANKSNESPLSGGPHSRNQTPRLVVYQCFSVQRTVSISWEFSSFAVWRNFWLLNSSRYRRAPEGETKDSLIPRLTSRSLPRAHATTLHAALYRSARPRPPFLSIRGETRLSGISPKLQLPDMYTRRLQKLGEKLMRERSLPRRHTEGTEAVIPGHGRARGCLFYT